ncbi:MAG: manganese/zinc/iron transport system permease protein [Cryomorphaceae bacterium]|jgi:manganese/zinc/iron transport system permease protein
MGGNFTWVMIGCALIGAGASAVGVFSFLRKQALVGDAVAHALLPGVVLAFMVTGQKDIWILFPGAFVAGWLGLLSIDFISKYSKIKSDTAIAIVLTVFFAVGIVLLTHVQQSNYGNQSGLEAFLFGKAAAMLPADITLFVVVDTALILLIVLTYRYLKLYSFDPDFAKAIGLPVKGIQFILSSLTVLAVASGIQAVGVVLMAALIITPAAAARFFTGRLSHMIILAMIIGIVSSMMGVYISSLAEGMPTGPWIVMVMSIIAIMAFIFAPGKGMLQRSIKRKAHQQKVRRENLLKLFYSLEEKNEEQFFSRPQLLRSRRFRGRELELLLNKLTGKGFLFREENRYGLTDHGRSEATRVVRLHRLWELYLNERMNIAPDHVHHDAEAIEHIITPELEHMLLKDLGYPELDPHSSEIPGIKDMKR